MNSAANRFGQGRRPRRRRRGAPDGDRLQPGQGHRHARPRGGRSAGSPASVRLGSSWPRSRRHRDHSAVFGFDPLVPELRAGDDRLDQAAEAAAVGRQPRSHGVDRRVVRRDQAPPEGVGQQLAAEVVDELLAALRLEVGAEPLDARPLAAAGERRRGCRPAGRRGRLSGPRRRARTPRRPGRSRRTARGSRRRPCRPGGGPGSRAGSGRRAWPRRRAGRGRSAGGAGMFSPSRRRTTQ